MNQVDHRLNEPKPKYVLYGNSPSRVATIHINAPLPRPWEIRPKHGARFNPTAFTMLKELLKQSSDTIHLRVVIDDARQLTGTPTTGHRAVDEVWWQNRIKKFTFHATPGSQVELGQWSSTIQQIRVTKGEVRLYKKDNVLIKAVAIPLLLLLGSGGVILENAALRNGVPLRKQGSS